ncbi:MAG: YihY/virulence factor BrkB family protein [Oscillospiraceae bacterium]|nr:YihY/virulence factor BrkB family protein [Oscillospiraceae bacterium]
MKEIPKGGLIGKIYHTIKWAAAFRVEMYAAHASYFIIISLFPTLVVLLAMLRYTGLEISGLLNLMETFVPEALFPLITAVVQRVYQNSSGMVLSISIVGALWSASRGVHCLMLGLNAIYGVKESRGYLYTRTVSVFYMFAFLAILVLTLILNVYSDQLLSFFSRWLHIIEVLDGILNFRFIWLILLQFTLFTMMYKFLPNEKVRFIHALPGAGLTVVGWLTFSKVYSLYVTHFSEVAGIYDSLYSVALGMLWLYLCISILFYGGVLNRAIMKKNM